MRDSPRDEDTAEWASYLARLRATGSFDGGSSIGSGVRVTIEGAEIEVRDDLVGYLLVRAESVNEARSFLGGNPTFEAGGAVEIRELLLD